MSDFSHAELARIVSRLSTRLSQETEALAYGMWNPLFCSADATAKARELFAEIRRELDHWEQSAIRSETNA